MRSMRTRAARASCLGLRCGIGLDIRISVADNSARMSAPQVPPRPDEFTLQSERLGRVPLVNRFLDRMGLEGLLDQYVADHRSALRGGARGGPRCAAALDHGRARGGLPPGRDGAGSAPGVRAECRADGAAPDDRIGRELDHCSTPTGQRRSPRWWWRWVSASA